MKSYYWCLQEWCASEKRVSHNFLRCVVLSFSVYFSRSGQGDDPLVYWPHNKIILSAKAILRHRSLKRASSAARLRILPLFSNPSSFVEADSQSTTKVVTQLT